jgi:hypothetical protein
MEFNRENRILRYLDEPTGEGEIPDAVCFTPPLPANCRVKSTETP